MSEEFKYLKLVNAGEINTAKVDRVNAIINSEQFDSVLKRHGIMLAEFQIDFAANPDSILCQRLVEEAEITACNSDEDLNSLPYLEDYFGQIANLESERRETLGSITSSSTKARSDKTAGQTRLRQT